MNTYIIEQKMITEEFDGWDGWDTRFAIEAEDETSAHRMAVKWAIRHSFELDDIRVKMIDFEMETNNEYIPA